MSEDKPSDDESHECSDDNCDSCCDTKSDDADTADSFNGNVHCKTVGLRWRCDTKWCCSCHCRRCHVYNGVTASINSRRKLRPKQTLKIAEEDCLTTIPVLFPHSWVSTCKPSEIWPQCFLLNSYNIITAYLYAAYYHFLFFYVRMYFKCIFHTTGKIFRW